MTKIYTGQRPNRSNNNGEQQRGHGIIVSSGIQNSSFRSTAMREKPLVNSVPQHGGTEFSCVEAATSPRSIWPEGRISLASNSEPNFLES